MGVYIYIYIYIYIHIYIGVGGTVTALVDTQLSPASTAITRGAGSRETPNTPKVGPRVMRSAAAGPTETAKLFDTTLPSPAVKAREYPG